MRKYSKKQWIKGLIFPRFIGNLRIRQKLIITYSLIIVIMLIFGGMFSYYIYSANYERQAVNSSIQIIVQLKRNVEFVMEDMDAFSMLYYNYDNLMNMVKKGKSATYDDCLLGMKDMDKLFFSFRNMKKQVTALYIITKDGKMYNVTRDTSLVTFLNKNYEDEDWYKNAVKAGGRPLFIGTHKSFVIQDYRLLYSIARGLVSFDTGAIDGVMLIDHDISGIEGICKVVDSNNGNTIIIADQSGRVVYSTDKSMIMKPVEKNIWDDITKLKKNIIIKKINGKNVIITNVYSTYSGWTFINIIPQENVLKGISSIRQAFIILGLLGILISILAAFMFARTISKPICCLTRLMKIAENGNMNVQVDIGGNDEIGELGRSFNSMMRKINDLIRSEYQAKIMKREAELKALQARINPHFLYNTLELISCLADINKVPKIGEICMVLADMLRYSVKSDRDFVTVEKELEHVSNYLYILKVRWEEKLKISMKIDEHIKKCFMPKLILQPLVENAVKHGIEHIEGVGLIEIKGSRESDNIIFVIKDNGIGMSEEKLEKVKRMLLCNSAEYYISKSYNRGIGLENIHYRIKLLYGEEFGIVDIRSTLNKGTELKIAIPFRKE